jgi:hypothetical protein
VVAALLVYSNRVNQHMYRFKQPFYKIVVDSNAGLSFQMRWGLNLK